MLPYEVSLFDWRCLGSSGRVVDSLARTLSRRQVHDLETQVQRAYAQLHKQPTVLLKQSV
jgi:hypothetical protein